MSYKIMTCFSSDLILEHKKFENIQVRLSIFRICNVSEINEVFTHEMCWFSREILSDSSPSRLPPRPWSGIASRISENSIIGKVLDWQQGF